MVHCRHKVRVNVLQCRREDVVVVRRHDLMRKIRSTGYAGVFGSENALWPTRRPSTFAKTTGRGHARDSWRAGTLAPFIALGSTLCGLPLCIP